MTTDDVARIAKEICIIFTLGERHFWAKASDPASHEADRVAQHFAGYMPERILRAVKDCSYEDPKHAPNPAQILERARANLGPRTGMVDPSNCRHPQPLAIVGERTEDHSEANPPPAPLKLEYPVGTRLSCCVRCGTESVHKPGRLLTDTELEEQKRLRREAQHA